ncbi:hypothetical protein C8T65DRAFT_736831 [Cerioporus squamosus]|nr:hypothetical protein C8T65DRAFT_736831 [Cerioporus squamosus]
MSAPPTTSLLFDLFPPSALVLGQPPSYSQAMTLAAEPARTRAVEPHPEPAEMLDEDNFAWGRPSRKQHSKTKWARS